MESGEKVLSKPYIPDEFITKGAQTYVRNTANRTFKISNKKI